MLKHPNKKIDYYIGWINNTLLYAAYKKPTLNITTQKLYNKRIE